MLSGRPRIGSEVVFGRSRSKAGVSQNSGEKIDFFGSRKAILRSRRSVEVRIPEGFLKDCLVAGPWGSWWWAEGVLRRAQEGSGGAAGS